MARARRLPRPAQLLGSSAALAMLLLAAPPLGHALAAMLAASNNRANVVSPVILYSPTAPTATQGPAAITLAWTAAQPNGNGNGNGYVVSGVANGSASTCPGTLSAYSTYVGSTSGTTLTDSSSPLLAGAAGSFVCYRIQTAYSPAGGPPWSSPPAYSSINALATVAVRLPARQVQAGPVATSAGPSVTPVLGAGSTAGSLLVATLGCDQATCGFSGPAGWNRAVTVTGPVFGADIWYYPNAPAGLTGAAFTDPAAGLTSGQISEWAGLSASAPLDVTGTATDSSGTASALTVATAASAAAGDLGITVFVTDNADPLTTFTAGAGWSLLGSGWNGNNFNLTSDQRRALPSAVASETESTGPLVPISWAAAIATFKQ